jgi:protein-S-isoprenylcysteine O-methyltransferase Ste14
MDKKHRTLHRLSYAPIVFLAAFSVSLILQELLPYSIGLSDSMSKLGFILLIIGTVLVLAADRHRRPFIREAGADPEVSTLESGPYKFTRHPVYLGSLLMYAGIACVMNALIILVSAGLIFFALTFIIIPREERLMQKTFPEAYATYRSRVRMWL